jgi:hypothetical protein
MYPVFYAIAANAISDERITTHFQQLSLFIIIHLEQQRYQCAPLGFVNHLAKRLKRMCECGNVKMSSRRSFAPLRSRDNKCYPA